MSIEGKAVVIALMVLVFAMVLWSFLVIMRQPGTDPVVIAAAIGSSAISSVSILVGLVFGVEAVRRRP